MWFGTHDGLNRFDGYQYKVFRNRITDKYSLPYNYIASISEDEKHNIWVGTGQGIGLYNPATEKFSTIYVRQYKQKGISSLISAINFIKKDNSGNIFVGSNGTGLFYKSKSDTLLNRIPFENNKHQPYLGTNVTAISIDYQNRAWIAVAGVGICSFDRKANTMALISSRHVNISSIVVDNDIIWLGTRDGLFRYKIAGNKMVPYSSPHLENFRNKNVTCLFLDKKQNLWVSTESDGLGVIDLPGNTVRIFKPDPGNSSAMGSESTLAIYADKDGRKWIGTSKGGVYVLEARSNPFQVIQYNPSNVKGLFGNGITCFNQDSERNLWIGTEGSGLNILNLRNNVFTRFTHNAGIQSSLSNNLIANITTDFKGDTWVTTYGGGINKYLKSSKAFKHYRCLGPVHQENKYALLIFQDSKNTLWVSHFNGGGLFRYNRLLDRFELFDADLYDIISLNEDSRGRLWAGNSRHLILVDRQHKQHVFYDIGKPIRAIFEDRARNLWLGTEGGGLILFDRAKGKAKAQLSDADGLSNNSVLNILQDKSGFLWLSTFNGLSQFAPKSKKFRNYYKADGLSTNQFSYNAAIRLKGGEMAFGGTEGITLFNPDSLEKSKKVNAEPYLGAIEINHQPLRFPNKYVQSPPNYNATTYLKVPYDEAVLSLGFSSIDFFTSGERTFTYHLEGWDKGWGIAKSSALVNYTRLSEGTYKLHVRRGNGVGDWGPDKVLLVVTMLPPWYRTWWAYLFYAGVTALCIYIYNSYRVRQAELKYELKLLSASSEKEKELNEKKLSFFTDVSHEFRTPITLIINPLGEFIKNNSNLQQSKELHLVYKNARRLLSLVNQLLLFIRSDADPDELRIVKLPFKKLCNDVFNSFLNQAKLKMLDFQFINTGEEIELYADREKIEVIVYNLLSNALKYTPAGGQVKMCVSANENEVELSVLDTGIGISPEVGNKLFDRFYQVIANKPASSSGLGIGLNLVKSFAEKHCAKVTYQSTLGEGTTFCLLFKKGNAHFFGFTVYEDVVDLPVLEVEGLPAVPVKTELDRLLKNKKIMLIIDDNQQILDYVSSVFSDEYEVLTASSGNAGLEKARQYMPEIIISDVMMDDGNGIDLCRAVKNDRAIGHTPIILLTAVSDSEIKLKGTESGADDYITKPFENDLLKARVKSLLKNRLRLQDYFFNEVTLKQHDFNVAPEYVQFLNTCIEIIDCHLQDENFSTKVLSTKIGMSRSALYRKVKIISGQSIAGFIRLIRLRKAAELMIQTNNTVSEISLNVGVGDPKYFREQFKAIFEMNPSEYIKKYRPAPIVRSARKDDGAN